MTTSRFESSGASSIQSGRSNFNSGKATFASSVGRTSAAKTGRGKMEINASTKNIGQLQAGARTFQSAVPRAGLNWLQIFPKRWSIRVLLRTEAVTMQLG